jgi:hypothetical protein
MNPKYPIYIISKGRWETRLTSKALEKMNVPYSIVIEPQEYKRYASAIDSKKILVLPFSNLGQGSIPARNWVWEHSVSLGAYRHWILDDNIHSFMRIHENNRWKFTDGKPFCICEDFADRYQNLALVGMNYKMFVPKKQPKNPITFNTRIYSCILIENNTTFRWRGKYNEDTDLSLNVLKAGLCTALFNAVVIDKATTMTMKGGNTDELYKQTNNRYEFAESLRRQHPDVVRITQKWGRYHHHVDYRPFKGNKLIKRPDAVIPEGVNNYGMKLVKRGE